MGAQVVVALAEQRGNRTTNPDGIVPEISNPVLQIGSLTLLPANSAPVLQKLSAVTASVSPTGPTSNPVLQRGSAVFPRTGSSAPDDRFIIQVAIGTGGSPLKPTGISEPLLQYEFTSDNETVQQFELKRATVADGTPIEQKGTITNNVSVEQFDFIELIFPPCGSIKNPTDTNILWRIRDFGFPFDVGSLIFIVDGIPVQNRSNFTVTDLVTGLELFYNPADDFGFDTEVQLFVQIDDTAVPSNRFFARCSWITVSDRRPPVVTNVTPCDQGTDVNIFAPVTFDVFDTGLGVDQSSIVLSIEGISVCSGITFDSEVFPGSGIGFHVEWNHLEDPFKFEANVTVAVTAGDLADPQNSVLFICDFDTEQSTSPDFQDFDPFPCESFVDTRTGLTFEVYGNLHGIDISTLEVRVDNKLRRVIVEPRILRSQ